VGCDVTGQRHVPGLPSTLHVKPGLQIALTPDLLMAQYLSYENDSHWRFPTGTAHPGYHGSVLSVGQPALPSRALVGSGWCWQPMLLLSVMPSVLAWGRVEGFVNQMEQHLL